MQQPNLVAFRISRRCLGVAVFRGFHLEYDRQVSLSSSSVQASASTVGFVSNMIERYSPETLAFERPARKETRAARLAEQIEEVARNKGIPVWDAGLEDLFNAYGWPALSRRWELRNAARSMWPSLDTKESNNLAQDAAALGLYVQIEKAFAH